MSTPSLNIKDIFDGCLKILIKRITKILSTNVHVECQIINMLMYKTYICEVKNDRFFTWSIQKKA